MYNYTTPNHKVFISFYHYDMSFKEVIESNIAEHLNQTVDLGDISNHLPDLKIREIIRDKYIRDSTVTIVLVSAQTRKRKFIDGEIGSSLYDGKINSKNGIVFVLLPHLLTSNRLMRPIYANGGNAYNRVDIKEYYDYLPSKIQDNLDQPGVVGCTFGEILANYREIIDKAYNGRYNSTYTISKFKKRNE